MISDVFFVTTLQGWAYKTQPTHETIINASRMLIVFCKPILAMFVLPSGTKIWKAEQTFQSAFSNQFSKNMRDVFFLTTF